MRSSLLYTIAVFFAVCCFPVVGLYAQEEEGDEVKESPFVRSGEIIEEDTKLEEDVVLEDEEILSEDPVVNDLLLRIKLKEPSVNTNQMASLFFTTWEENLVADARKGLVTRPATVEEVEESQEQVAKAAPPPMGPRELSLGGIVFISSGDWAVWLNGQKITPDKLPPEIVDIRVQKDYIKLKWYDAYTNQIFPIKLKSHQRFNIDSRIFLPGLPGMSG